MRFLKAKLRVMQEELDRLTQELNAKVAIIFLPDCFPYDAVTFQEELITKSQVKIKEYEEERNRKQRTASSLQTQLEKYKRLADDAKGKADSLDTQLSAAKKVFLTTFDRHAKIIIH
jgi:hypothetical protein